MSFIQINDKLIFYFYQYKPPHGGFFVYKRDIHIAG